MRDISQLRSCSDHPGRRYCVLYDHLTVFHGRHYTDLVLVAVVALCTQENDVIHAGYLALALLFFRRRDSLRTERNRCPSSDCSAHRAN